eukprot:2273658-Rhodomonas_salina.2
MTLAERTSRLCSMASSTSICSVCLLIPPIRAPQYRVQRRTRTVPRSAIRCLSTVLRVPRSTWAATAPRQPRLVNHYRARQPLVQCSTGRVVPAIASSQLLLYRLSPAPLLALSRPLRRFTVSAGTPLPSQYLSTSVPLPTPIPRTTPQYRLPTPHTAPQYRTLRSTPIGPYRTGSTSSGGLCSGFSAGFARFRSGARARTLLGQARDPLARRLEDDGEVVGEDHVALVHGAERLLEDLRSGA